jgi:hypothetical protein
MEDFSIGHVSMQSSHGTKVDDCRIFVKGKKEGEKMAQSPNPDRPFCATGSARGDYLRDTRTRTMGTRRTRMLIEHRLKIGGQTFSASIRK